MSKRQQKAQREARRAVDAFFDANFETRRVRSSPRDETRWRVQPDNEGRVFYTLVLQPPDSRRTTWSVVAWGADSIAYVRRDLTEEKARALYGRINDQTRIDTLWNNHGFRTE